MKKAADDFVTSIYGGLPSVWDDPWRRRGVIAAYRRGEKELMSKWPRDDEDGLAVALGNLRAFLGY